MTDVSYLILGNQDLLINVKHMIPQSWLLLDTRTTRSVSNNIFMVNDITGCKCEDWLKLHTNEGPTIFKQMEKLKLLPLTVHFNESSMAKIISFLDVCDANDPNNLTTRDTRMMTSS